MPAERAGYTITMFMIDVSPSMGESRVIELPPGPKGESRTIETTNLQWSLKYVKYKIQQMIFAGRKTDKCGVILFGTEDTSNPVSDAHGGYDHVTEFLPIQTPTPRTLAAIDDIEPSTEIGDFLDGLIVGTFVQNEELGTKKWKRKAVVITDGQNPLEIEDDDIQNTVKKLNEWDVEVTIIGVDFDDPDFPFEEPNKTSFKRANEEFYHSFAKKLNTATVGTMEEALLICSEPEIKAISSTLMKNSLIIGDKTNRPEEALEINISISKATSVVNPPPLKKFAKPSLPKQNLHAGDNQSQSLKFKDSQSEDAVKDLPPPQISLEASPLELRTVYVVAKEEEEEDTKPTAIAPKTSGKYGGLDDDSDEEMPPPPSKGLEAETEDGHHEKKKTVSKDDLVKAYRYGKTWVPFEEGTGEDVLPSIQGLEIVGFSYESLWTRDWSMGEVYYIFGEKANPRAQVAFSSLVRAMHQYTKKKTGEDGKEADGEGEPAPVLAICRLVSRDNSAPKMGVALPRTLDSIDYLVWVRMPFAEDLRRFTFPSLDVIKSRNGKPREKHPFLPTDTMQEAMDDLVLASDLSDAGPRDEDGNRKPWFDPTESVNPAVHRLKQALFHAAITNDTTLDPVPPPHPDLVKFFERPKKIVTRSAKAVEACQKEFNVTKTPARTKFRKRKNGDDELAEDADQPLSLTDLLQGDAYVSTSWGMSTETQTQKTPPKRKASAFQSPSKKRGKKRASSDTESESEPDDNIQAMDIDPRYPGAGPSGFSGQGSTQMQTNGVEYTVPLIVGEGSAPNRIIGNVHPLFDFQQNISRGDVVSKAVADLGAVIFEVVEKSFSAQRYDEALDCMQAMRDTCLKEDEVEEWNAFLRRLKKMTQAPSSKCKAFWDRVKAVGPSISLINEEEAAENGITSEVSMAGSLRFIKE